MVSSPALAMRKSTRLCGQRAVAGARYVAKEPWTPHAVFDGNLVTGQQNYLAGLTDDAVL